MAMEWLYTMRRPEDERVQPPVLVRRLAAVIALTAFPVLELLLKAEVELLPGLGDVPYVLLALAVGLAWLLSVAVVYEFRRRLANARDDQLDERERTVRDQAHLISYRILGWLIMLLALAVLVVAPLLTGSREISLDVVLDAVFSLVIVTIVLPSAVIAWRDTESGELDDEALDPEVA